jgi:hypothetical protein
MTDHTIHFNDLYRDRAIVQINEETSTVHVETLTDLFLPTGQIVACDPSYNDTTPFIQSVAPGRYRVSIAMIRHPQRGNRPLAARLHLAEGEVARWVLALRSGDDASTLKPGEYFCYGVDAGLGCFMDVQTARKHTDLLNDPDSPDEYWIALMDKYYLTELPYWMNHIVDESTGANLVMFSSGWGDGCYPTYEGWSADGRLLTLMTDFGLR